MSTPMNNDTFKQQLSALMDGELERDQARFLLKRVENDAELAACWQGWHVAGDCLRGQGTAPLRDDFASRIASALEADRVPRRGLGGTVLKWAGGAAVAASVALAALLAVDPASPPESTVPAVPALAQQPATPIPTAEVAPSRYREEDLRPPLRLDTQRVSASDVSPFAAAVRIDPRIESYLVRHNEATAGQGFVPYVTLVTPLRERAATPEPQR